jgi:hypothetical protein
MFQFKLRRDLSHRWIKINPVLAEGEPGYETDTGKFKVGTGHTSWTDLPYFVPRDTSGVEVPLNLVDHIDHPTPHPVYDDGPSLFLLYENAKV